MTSVDILNPHLDKDSDKPQQNSEAGFSLLEIMVALVIIGLLTAAVVINVAPNVGTAQKTRAKSDIRSLTTALELYRLDAPLSKRRLALQRPINIGAEVICKADFLMIRGIALMFTAILVKTAYLISSLTAQTENPAGKEKTPIS